MNLGKPLQRALSMRQAQQCENACNPRCRCRCGGTFHGKGRIRTQDSEAFHALPEDDPHWVPTKERRRQLALERKQKRLLP